MRLAIVLVAGLAACGTDDKSDSPAGNPEPESTTQDPQAPADEPAPQPQAVPYSMALDSAAALPVCDTAHDKQLVYLLTERKFVTCQVPNWQAVEIVAPEPAPNLAAIKNALATIELGTPLTEVLPEARAVLLGEHAEHSEDDNDSCNPKLPGDDYTVLLEGWYYSATVRAGIVESICQSEPGEDPQCEVRSCTER